MTTPTVKLSQRAAAYRSAAAIILGLGVMITMAAIFYGITKVAVDAGDNCGSGFSSTYSTNSDLTSDGADACAVAESGRQATTHGLLGAGVGGIVLSLVVFAAAGSVQDERLQQPRMPEPGADSS